MARDDRLSPAPSPVGRPQGEGLDALTEGQLLKLLVDHINDGIIVMDRGARILWTNAGFSRQTGWSAEEARGRRPQEFLMPQEVRPSQAEIDQFDFDMVPEDFEDFQIVQNMRKDGGRYWVQLAFSQADLQEGVRVICAARDISGQVAAQDALAAAKAELEHSVNSDVLTGLANRRRLGEVLAEALEGAAARDGQVALFHVDLDKFKEVNDTHGHAAGDAILVHAAEAMTRSTREQDLVARVGGDEFVIVMPTAPTPQELAEFARRIIHEVTRPLPWEEVELQCGASIGIAVSDPGLLDGEELIQQADFALYDVKQKGRGSYASYDQALADKHLEKKRMAEDLRRTVGEGGLHFHFQPVLSLATQEIIGVETLARWMHPTRGLIAPAEFIAMAEDNGLLTDLDMSAMQACAEALAELRGRGFHRIGASFNASSQTLATGGLLDRLKWTAERLELPHERLWVEVLETVVFGGDAAETDLAREIEGLVAAGFPTLLDDFGVGYAGLSHLAQLHVTGIKIDRSLVRTLSIDPTSAAIVHSIVRLTEELGLTVTAEGVEDASSAAMLAAMGCERAQGFGIARPMPLPQLIEWLDQFDPDMLFRDDEGSEEIMDVA